QLVNIIGSIFYGNVLGIFLLAFFFKYIKGKAVFYGAIITQILVILSFYLDLMSYLWLNVLGCVLVVVCAHVLSVFLKEKQTAP
ncbi:sodium:solute symporter, partial [Flavobacteriaceae bacterium]|nr:sodium:solute symporter [Flavobacteriaceae bacterium]